MRRLHLRLFGPFAATLGETAVTEFEALSARALLAYLAIERGHSQPRASLAALLWGPNAGATGLTNLRSCLRRVRSALGDGDDQPPLLQITPDAIQIDGQAEIWTDAQQFEALLTQVNGHSHRRVQHCPWCMARLMEAVTLYRGPFLADLRISSIVFEEWQQVYQERYHRLAMQALYALTDYHYHRGELTQAEAFARRQLALEVWNEEAHQQLIRILAASGQRSAALAQYGRCRAILAAELDVPPMPETTALYQEIRRGPVEFPIAVNVCIAQTLPGSQTIPIPATELVDRRDELEELLQSLVSPPSRLFSLVGEGGVGKTRLAMAVAQALIGCFADGVWFVALADATGSADVRQAEWEITAAMAAVVGLFVGERQNLQEQLFAFLRAKELLIVLDNFEHLLAGAGLLNRILRAAPNISFLVTSRQPLNFQAEHVVRLTGLATPPENNAAMAAKYAAVALFETRARQCHAQFNLTTATLPAVVRICRLVHGLPLGIELAATLVREMTPAEIAAAMTTNLDLLATSRGDVSPRHRSMRAVFEASWRLLTPAQQTVLARLAVLRSNFTRAAAQAVAGASPVTLAELVERSLLQVDEDGRYYTHALLQQFAMEKLQQPAQTLQCHSRFYLAFVCQLESSLYGANPNGAVALVRAELSNIQQACLWASEHEEWAAFLQILDALERFYSLTGLTQEAAALFEKAIECAQTTSAEEQFLVRLEVELASAELECGNTLRALARIERALQRAAFLDDQGLQARSHLVCGAILHHQGETEASRAHLDQALKLARLHDNPRLEARCLVLLDYVTTHTTAHIEQALALAQTLDDATLKAAALDALGHAALYQGRLVAGYHYWQRSVEMFYRHGNLWHAAWLHNNLAEACRQLGDYVTALTHYETALQTFQHFGAQRAEAKVHEGLARLYADMAEYDQAWLYGQTALHLSQALALKDTQAFVLNNLGRIHLAHDEIEAAIVAYLRALECGQQFGWPGLVLESKAGLAAAYLAQVNLSAVIGVVNDIHTEIHRTIIDPGAIPMPVYLHCYHVLAAAQHPYAAHLLSRGYQVLQSQAAQIEDAGHRQRFLERVPANHAIMSAWLHSGNPG